jgi:aspartate aminotransferase-like enzyme
LSSAPDHPILFTPGPTEVAPDILREMSRPVIGHRGEEMQAILGEIITRAREVFGAPSHDIFLTGSSATGLWEAAVRNGVARRLLVPVCGAFSERFFEVALACGVAADRIDAEWGRAVDPAAVDAALATGAYDAVALVHNETSTGVVNPLASLAEVVRRHPDVLLFVDCVSSLAGMPVLVDRHGIDVALASVQKCLALPPGLAICAVSPRAMERSRTRPNKGYYFDFVRLKGFFDKRVPLATPSGWRRVTRVTAPWPIAPAPGPWIDSICSPKRRPAPRPSPACATTGSWTWPRSRNGSRGAGTPSATATGG